MTINRIVVLLVAFFQSFVFFASQEGTSKKPLFFEILTMNQIDKISQASPVLDLYLKEEEGCYVVLLNNKPSDNHYLPLSLPSAYRLCKGIESSEWSGNLHQYIQFFVKTENWKKHRLNNATKCFLDVRTESNKEKAKKFCDWFRPLYAAVDNGPLFDAVVRSNSISPEPFCGLIRPFCEQRIDLNQPLFYVSLESVDVAIAEKIKKDIEATKKEKALLAINNEIIKRKAELQYQNRKIFLLEVIVFGFVAYSFAFLLTWLEKN